VSINFVDQANAANHYTTPPNMVYVTTLPCKITILPMFYTRTTINTLPLGKIFTFRSDSC